MSLKRASLIAVTGQVASIAYSLVSVPLLLSAYGNELFGIWGLISSLVAYLTLSNFGIPTAATVYIANASIWSERILIYKKSFRLLLLLITAVAVVLIPASGFVQWENIFGKVTSENIDTAKIAASVMLIGFLLRVPFTIATAGFAGVQRIDLTKLYELTNSTVTFGCLLSVIKLGGDLVLLAVVTSGASLGVSLIAFAHFSLAFGRGNLEECTFDGGLSYKELLGKGVYFFQAGLASTIVWNTTPFLVSYIIGAEALPFYTIPQRLYILAATLVTLVSGLLIPLYARLVAEQAWDSLQRLYGSLSVILPLASGAVWVGGAFLCQPIINLWTGKDDLQIDSVLVLFLGAYAFILSKIHLQIALLTALNSARATAKIAWIEAGLNLVITIPAVYILGIAGAAVGTFFAALLSPYILSAKSLRAEGIKKNPLQRYERFLFGLTTILACTSSLVSNLISSQIWLSILVGLLFIATYIVAFVAGITQHDRRQLYEMLSQLIRFKL